MNLRDEKNTPIFESISERELPLNHTPCHGDILTVIRVFSCPQITLVCGMFLRPQLFLRALCLARADK
jgi:hypothetical protein